ncbi:MAG: agmatinase [Porticoccaceae bacterium]|jgi:guanidinobutyrase|nr:MAG: agmatinase [SAR92 bacterium BACL16 MAG-120619-bin48]MDP4653649.1 agmatinase [Alphaproteobacteria bacterium]MDP4743832.1 agmatinase [Porticoccaceae bacterium]MDP4752901.1 agmatinase [Porticoccaceae bacterium]
MSKPNSAFNQPLGGNDMPRFAGQASFFRLPVHADARGLDVALIGMPVDIGTSNRSGARFGPRQIRAESVLVRPYGMATQAAPFDSFQIADIGDVAVNPYNLLKTVDAIEAAIDAVLAEGAKPISVGGDHTCTLPVLRALHKVHGPVALIHIDAHADINDTMFGEKIAHGTVFRRAIEEGLIQTPKMFQIGLRATGYAADDFDWSREQGARVITAEECWYKSLTPLMNEIRGTIGSETPVYLTFDIDGLDPSVAPGTGTPEPGGLSASQGLEVIRGCFGLNLVGCDLMEVSPPYDSSGNTALLAANLLFEMLCSLPGCIRRS